MQLEIIAHEAGSTQFLVPWKEHKVLVTYHESMGCLDQEFEYNLNLTDEEAEEFDEFLSDRITVRTIVELEE